MKKFCGFVVIILIVTFYTPVIFANDLEKTNIDSKHAIDSLKSISVVKEERNFGDTVSRMDCLKLLVDIYGDPGDVHDALLEEVIKKYKDVKFSSDGSRYLYIATEILGIFVGKQDNQGQLIAALEEPLTWNDALLMCMRTLYDGKGRFDPIYCAEIIQNENFLIEQAQRCGVINYPLGGYIGLEVQYENLHDAVTWEELCVLINRVLHTPIVVNAYGGPYTKYLIDNFTK